jgi:molybdenum cofactor cytidylyltransferase
VNAQYADGQGTSVAAGARAVVPGASAALFLLADQPLVRAPLIDRLLAEHAHDPQSVLVPTCEGQRGNPVLFPASLLPALGALADERGGRAILLRAPDRVREVETGDPAVLADLDTPADLRRVDDDLSRP